MVTYTTGNDTIGKGEYHGEDPDYSGMIVFVRHRGLFELSS